MSSINEIRAKLKDRRLTVVAEQTGLHYNTVWRIATGRNSDPSYGVVKRLAEYLELDGDIKSGGSN